MNGHGMKTVTVMYAQRKINCNYKLWEIYLGELNFLKLIGVIVEKKKTFFYEQPSLCEKLSFGSKNTKFKFKF